MSVEATYSPALAQGPARGPALALAALGPVAIGGILASRAGDVSPVLATPAIIFGVVAATSPALYIAIAAAGEAPPLAAVARALAAALAAFGIALAGVVLPAAFLSLSSTTDGTTIAVCGGALAGAALLALRRLSDELATRTPLGRVLFGVWAIATLGVAGRLWWDLALEVMP